MNSSELVIKTTNVINVEVEKGKDKDKQKRLLESTTTLVEVPLGASPSNNYIEMFKLSAPKNLSGKDISQQIVYEGLKSKTKMFNEDLLTSESQ